MEESRYNFYHPFRYTKSRPFTKTLLKKYKGQSLPTMSFFQEVTADFINIFNEELSYYPIPDRKWILSRYGGNGTDYINRETTLFMEYQRFIHRGKNIFYFPEKISELFKKTDVADITIENIHFPYKSFYLAFGPQIEFDLGYGDNRGNYFDGAYINQLNETKIEFRLTSSNINRDANESSDWLTEPEIINYISLKFESPEEKFTDALERYIDKTIETFSKWDDEPGSLTLEGGPSIVRIDNSHPARRKRLNHVLSGAEKFREISRLIFNAICYLTYEKRDIQEFYTNNPPDHLVKKLSKAKKTNQKSKLESEMSYLGYSLVKICGNSIADQYGSGKAAEGDKATHWRRGHWRSQAYGDGMMKRKVIWIMPTLIRGDKGDSSKGHIYTVDKS